MNFFKFSSNNKNGLTLVELLVATSIFSLVVLAAIGLLITSIKAQRKSIAIQNVQDNARYIIDFMSKEIRMSDFTSGNSTALTIDHPVNGKVTYTFDNANNRVLRNGDVINSDKVKTFGNFYISGLGIGDGKQPYITIVLKVWAVGNKPEQGATIKLQTTLSQRRLE